MAVCPLLTPPVEQVQVGALRLDPGRRLATFHDGDREASACEAGRRSKARRPTTGNDHIHSGGLGARSDSNGLPLCSMREPRVGGAQEKSRQAHQHHGRRQHAWIR